LVLTVPWAQAQVHILERLQVTAHIREVAHIPEAAHILEVSHILEVAGNKPCHSDDTDDPLDRDGNPVGTDIPRIGSGLVRQEEAKSRDCQYADT
jgi:hypothetical protein